MTNLFFLPFYFSLNTEEGTKKNKLTKRGHENKDSFKLTKIKFYSICFVQFSKFWDKRLVTGTCNERGDARRAKNNVDKEEF